MSESSSDDTQKNKLRQKIIGLGEHSTRKSYYPQLVQKIKDLEDQSGRLQRTVETLENKEKALTEALEEREDLIQEIHHRVKNTFQIISSLLRLQSANIENPTIQKELAESQNRIYVMSMVYEKLYQSENLHGIPFHEFIHDLLTKVLMLHSDKAEGLDLKEEIEEVHLNLNTAIPLALVAAELLSNACKYGCVAQEVNTLRVVLNGEASGAGQRYQLTIADNGPGLPEGLDVENPSSLGLQLVFLLAEQLLAEVRYDSSENGTSFTVEFDTDAGAE